MEKENGNIVMNHHLCFDLTMQYLIGLIENISPDDRNKDYSGEVKKHQEHYIMGQGFTGKAWVLFFLKDFVPTQLRKEKDESR